MPMLNWQQYIIVSISERDFPAELVAFRLPSVNVSRAN